MIKTTVYIDRATLRSLDELARAQGESRAALIRAAVNLYLSSHPRPYPKGVGACRSGRSDVSERVEELLTERVPYGG